MLVNEDPEEENEVQHLVDQFGGNREERCNVEVEYMGYSESKNDRNVSVELGITEVTDLELENEQQSFETGKVNRDWTENMDIKEVSGSDIEEFAVPMIMETKFEIPVVIQQKQETELMVLLDSGAGISFIKEQWVEPENRVKCKPFQVTSAFMDGAVCKEFCELTFKVNGIKFKEKFGILTNAKRDLILGLPFICRHDDVISFKTMTFAGVSSENLLDMLADTRLLREIQMDMSTTSLDGGGEKDLEIEEIKEGPPINFENSSDQLVNVENLAVLKDSLEHFRDSVTFSGENLRNLFELFMWFCLIADQYDDAVIKDPEKFKKLLMYLDGYNYFQEVKCLKIGDDPPRVMTEFGISLGKVFSNIIVDSRNKVLDVHGLRCQFKNALVGIARWFNTQVFGVEKLELIDKERTNWKWLLRVGPWCKWGVMCYNLGILTQRY